MSDLEIPGQSGSGIEAAASSEGGSESEDKDKNDADEMGMLFREQASTGNGTDIEDRNVPATTQPPIPTHAIGPGDYSSSGGMSIRLRSPSPVPGPLLDASSGNPFTVSALETRTGRKRKTRDLHAMLAVCTCGEAVTENEIAQDENVIDCRRAGCETGWVSEIVI